MMDTEDEDESDGRYDRRLFLTLLTGHTAPTTTFGIG
jgi:hypothetical protein